jgi:hypothetical protein
MFDELSARSPITVIANAVQRRILRTRTQVRYEFPLWRQIFRPCTLGIIGLAIAIVLWGAGYKLSLYHRHATPSSVPVAKLWIESRNASMTAASGFKAKSYLISGSQAFFVPIQLLPRLSRAVASILIVCVRDVAYFDFLIPFRSPPPPRFLLV